MSEVQESKQSVSLGGRVIAVLFGLIFFVAGGFIFFQYSLPPVMLRITGVAIEGVVERLVESEYERGGPTSGESKYHVYYSFVLHEGEVIQGHTQLTGSDWFSLKVGQRVTVLYLSNNPGHNCLADYRLWEVGVLIMIVFPFLFGGIGAIIVVYAVRSKNGQSLARKNSVSKVTE